jgi:tellurite resistance-related uncharacterized protein
VPDPLPYRTTPVFDETSLPQALRHEHRTRAGVWGVIHVLDGGLKLTLLDPPGERTLAAGDRAVVLPQQPHFVTPLGPVRMQVGFYDQPPALPAGDIRPS